jgi:hypothetical protein
MAKLALPTLPEFLFRYRALSGDDDVILGSDTVLEREVEAIKKPYIWCADFRKLNDPMEGLFAPTRRLKKHTRRQEIVDAIIDGTSGVGIASFSDTNSNELMWTHYAARSTGICIEYRPQKLLTGLPDGATLVRVGYDEKPAFVSVADLNDPPRAIKKVLSQKKFNWAYEREWRLLSVPDMALISDTKAVKRVYLGTRISEYHRGRLTEALSNTGIQLLEMRVKGYSYTQRKVTFPKSPK